MTGNLNTRTKQNNGARAVAIFLYLLATGAANAQDGDSASVATAADDTADMTAIHTTVFDYFEGLNNQDEQRLERAFDPSAQLKSPSDDGTVRVEPISAAIARWLRGDNKQSRVGNITAVDITDGRIARVVFDFDGVYTDFLILMKLDGQWKIVDKVFIRQ